MTTKKTSAKKSSKPATKKPAAKKETTKATTKPAAEKKQTVERDAFGSKIDSPYAQFNAALSRKPQTMSELTKAAGLEGTFFDHVNRLVGKGLVTKSEERPYRFSLPSKSK